MKPASLGSSEVPREPPVIRGATPPELLSDVLVGSDHWSISRVTTYRRWRSAGLRHSCSLSTVAGAYAPAFVERRIGSSPSADDRTVAGAYAPAFVERARRESLAGSPSPVAGAYAPAFVERSPGSARSPPERSAVAGAYAPAFVERRTPAATATATRRTVAGAYAPAFVERPRTAGAAGAASGLSPGLMLRPSLSVLDAPVPSSLSSSCRRGLCSGLR